MRAAAQPTVRAGRLKRTMHTQQPTCTRRRAERVPSACIGLRNPRVHTKRATRNATRWRHVRQRRSATEPIAPASLESGAPRARQPHKMQAVSRATQLGTSGRRTLPSECRLQKAGRAATLAAAGRLKACRQRTRPSAATEGARGDAREGRLRKATMSGPGAMERAGVRARRRARRYGARHLRWVDRVR